ncbi:MAG: transcriptional regulator TrmB [Streptosporangiaceae bacterium]|nr:transcriptional regulator TrmB [Streptosporangiaceae bacterium]
MDQESRALREQVGQLVLRFIAGVVLHNQAVSARVGLGASDAQFLNLLALNGPMTPGQLATVTGLTTGSVTGVLDRLERAGYTRRERDPHDRRRVLVTSVPEGMARLAEHYAEHGEHMAAVLARQTPDELRVIAEFLRALTDTPDGYVTPARTPGDSPDSSG